MSRSDTWLNEVAVLERHEGGRFSMKATSPEFGDRDHVGAGIALGGGTGLLLGLIGGPLGLIFGGAMGAATGGAIGSKKEPGAFDPLVDQVKDALPRGSSALILVAEPATSQQLVAAEEDQGQRVLRQDLTDEQVGQLTQAAVQN